MICVPNTEQYFRFDVKNNKAYYYKKNVFIYIYISLCCMSEPQQEFFL